MQANQIILTVQPDEGVSVSLGAKIPGPRMRIRPVNMEFRYGTSFLSESPEAYERLILDAMRGDATLFTRNDEIEALWGIIDPILTAWHEDTTSPIPQYPAGSAGPREADALLDERTEVAAAVRREMTSGLPQLIVLGPPGAGKGTQAKRLAERLGLVHLSPGRLLRDACIRDGTLGERPRRDGRRRACARRDRRSTRARAARAARAPAGLVLDGYPRTPQQAEALRGMLARLGRLERRPVVLSAGDPPGELMRRLRHRAAQEHRPDDNERVIAAA